MPTWRYAEQLRSFDQSRRVPHVDVSSRTDEIVYRGNRSAMRPRLCASLAVGAMVAASCWWGIPADGTFGQSEPPRLATLEQLEELIVWQEAQLAALREVREALENASRPDPPHRRLLASDLDRVIAPTIAAKTLLHTATVRRDSIDTKQLNLVVQHFAGTDEATEAARLLHAAPL